MYILVRPLSTPSFPHSLNFWYANTPCRTQVVDKDLSPVWDETFEFSVKDYSRVLNVAVMDRDVIVDEIIGSFTINLEDMLHKKRVSATVVVVVLLLIVLLVVLVMLVVVFLLLLLLLVPLLLQLLLLPLLSISLLPLLSSSFYCHFCDVMSVVVVVVVFITGAAGRYAAQEKGKKEEQPAVLYISLLRCFYYRR